MKGKKASTAGPPSRATLTALPEGVLEVIGDHLFGKDKAHLAICCKALLPILGMGRVLVHFYTRRSMRPLLEATRCLTEQPSRVSRLEVFGHAYYDETMCFGTRGLIDLSLLSNLRELTLDGVAVSLPALQPVAMRLRELNVRGNCLQGSADGFFTRGWTALSTLSLQDARVETAIVTAALQLPALENLNIDGFRHQGGVLQLDQLAGSCPNIKGLRLQLEDDLAWGRQGGGPCCSLLDLGRLEDLYMVIFIRSIPPCADLGFDLPASLTQFEVQGASGGEWVLDLFWFLSEAVKCIRRGAPLHKLTCTYTEAYLQPPQWGATLNEQYRRLGGQLSSLRELEVSGDTEKVLSALCAVVSSAPHIAYVKFTTGEWLPLLEELPPIHSASLESITFIVDEPSWLSHGLPRPPPVLTFLHGCTRLQRVLLRLPKAYHTEGTAAKIRCHSGSQACVVPIDVHARAAERRRVLGYVGNFNEVCVEILPGPPSPQVVQSYTVLYTCHAAGPQQPLVWGHAVVPGFV